MDFGFLKDEETRRGWQSNIAMSFFDAYLDFQTKNKKGEVSMVDLHEIANKAANNFLNLLTK